MREILFGSRAESVATNAMDAVDPSLTSQFVSIVRFLGTQPGLAKSLRGESAPKVGTDAYIEKLALDFSAGRAVRGPRPPTTVPDEMVSKILIEYFGVDRNKVENVKTEHLLAMASEGIVGNVLEHYIASVAEPHGWTWCSGNMVLAVDFIREPDQVGAPWRMLQIKNRSNSENSSSSKIRKGTTIEKWYRVNANNGSTKWDSFPDLVVKSKLNEKGFSIFLSNYLELAKQS